MDLWIRSQDRESLKKINTGFYLKQDLSYYAKGEVIFIVSGGDKLGEYETKERALEVLDEIHNFIENDGSETTMINDNTKIEFTTTTIRKKVYEMPKE